MTYELAKKLKDASFPIHKGGRDVRLIDKNGKTWKAYYFDDGNDPAYPIVPTLSELIEACGDVIIKLWCNKKRNEYGIQPEGKVIDDVIWYSTPEEAVANLWLELNKK